MAGRPPLDRGFDPELEDIYKKEPELRDVARRLHASLPDPVPAPHFKAYLRARLVDAAAAELRPRGLRRLRPRPAAFAWTGAGLGVAMIAAVVATVVLSHPHDSVVVSANSQVDGQANVDPNDVIRISFTQAMDHAAVEGGLRIQPATQVTRQWDGNTLVLTPVNKLSGNTPYTVTIAKASARAADGSVAPADIHIAFGTHPAASPTPTPTPTGPPQLALHPVVPVDGGAQLIIGGDGNLLASNAAPTSASSVPATPAPGSPAPATATPLPLGVTLTPAPTPSAPAPGLFRVSADGTAQRLGDPVAAIALSSGERSLALLGPADGSGHAAVEVANADGSHLTTLTTTDDPQTPLAWGGDDLHPMVIFVTGGSLHTVDLQGKVRTVPGQHAIPARATVVFSADGRYAYIGPAPSSATPATTPGSSPTPGSTTPAATPGGAAAQGIVVDLVTGNGHPLNHAATAVAFSRDGNRVLWVDSTSAALLSAASAGGDSVNVPVPGVDQGSSVDSLAVDGSGSRIAYILHHANGAGELRVAKLPAGTVLATVSSQGLGRPVLSAGGDTLATVAGGTHATAELASLPGAATGEAPSSVPAEAAALVNKLVDAQVGGSVGTLGSLVAPQATADLVTVTPAALSRGYVVRIERAPGSSTTVVASIRLIRDPSKLDTATLSPALSSDETATVDRATAGGPYALTAIAATPLRPEPLGAQVVHVDSSGDPLSTVLHITFDSDLRSETVAKAITVLNSAGKHLDTSVTYDPSTRVATVSVTGARPLTLIIGVSLIDVEGQPLAAPYRTTLNG
jgi:Big-like domain-containing protein